MIRLCTILLLLISAAGVASAAQQSAVLHFDNMVCGADPHVIREALAKVPGVGAVEISLEQHTAVVTFDNAVATFIALQTAAGAAGYPAR